MTAEHLRTGKEYDASLIWTEDTTQGSFKVCLREMQNFDGKHEDINVVCNDFQCLTCSFIRGSDPFNAFDSKGKKTGNATLTVRILWYCFLQISFAEMQFKQ